MLKDTLLVNDSTGKATLAIQVSEGEPYRVGTFEIVGNRRFSTDELEALYPFSQQGRSSVYFNKDRWDEATRDLQTLYYNNTKWRSSATK